MDDVEAPHGPMVAQRGHGLEMPEPKATARIHKLWADAETRQLVKVEAAKARVSMIAWLGWAVRCAQEVQRLTLGSKEE